MSKLNISLGATTDYSDIAAYSLDTKQVDSVRDGDETSYVNDRWGKDYGFFMQVPKLHSAILMKAIWTVGKGYTTDPQTKVILDHIVGNGKQTFKDILFNMVVTKQVGRDAFAEIIRDPDTDTIINMKILDPQTIRIVYGSNGMIKRYEQLRPNPAKGNSASKTPTAKGDVFQIFQPEDIFHLSHNNFSGSIHGTSVPEIVEKKILADEENFAIMQKLTRFQAVPFIMFKVKSDNTETINTFKANIKLARTSGEDLIIPDDENLLSWEIVQVNPSSILMEWRNSLNNEFYQAVGLPLILFGTAGSSESGGKIEYLGHETVFQHDQLEIEEQIYAQLGLQIDLNPPTSLVENLLQDESKDQQNALTFQPNDVTAGSGR